MARYLVLRCETNESAEVLMRKLEPISHVNAVALYAIPTAFCDGTCPKRIEKAGYTPVYVRSKKYGTRHCPVCKKPTDRMSHGPLVNLLQEPNLHPSFTDMYMDVKVKEPFHNKPREKYGDQAVDGKNRQLGQYSGKRTGRSQRRRQRRLASGG